MGGNSSDEDERLKSEALELLDQDTSVSDDAKYVAWAAMEGDAELAEALDSPVPAAMPHREVADRIVEPVGAFLKSISVRGFRGIGPKATLELHPAAGLTVVAGRNGSGKSSFSEGLETAITGTTYRWNRKLPKIWMENWRNLHESGQPEIVVELAEEGAGLTKIGIAWDSDDFKASKRWVQRPGKPREDGTDSLGWEQPLQRYRPILSYDELSDLIKSSALFDRINTVLGLGFFETPQERLATAKKEREASGKHAKAIASDLKKDLETITEERATRALALLKRPAKNLDELQALATGTTAEPPGDLAALKSLAALPLPAAEAVAVAVTDLQTAQQKFVTAGTVSVEQAVRRIDLLRRALEFHQHQGDGRCPVCGTGQLNAQWQQRVEQELVDERKEITQRQAAHRDLDDARNRARTLIRSVTRPTAPKHLGLTTLLAAEALWDRWNGLISDPDSLAEQLQRAHGELAVAFEAVRVEAARLLAGRENVWAPLAVRLAEWVALARTAEAAKPTVTRVSDGADALRKVVEELRRRRLTTIEKKAREIWAELRQESNVDLDGIELAGQGNRRHVELRAGVDGNDAQALSVMSQGELHALALALFLPRATMAESPFRFIVLDDPIQAMDPAKVEGFVRVLEELAQDRQVIVLSHDDRLPQAIRSSDVRARIVEVCRDANSVVRVEPCEDPSRRYINDAFALIMDKEIPVGIRAKVLPILFRNGAEAAAHDRYFANRLKAGDPRVDVEQAWQDAGKTSSKLALTLRGSAQASVWPWLNKSQYRGPAYKLVTSGAHEGRTQLEKLSDQDLIDVARDVERLVKDIREGAS